MTVSITATWLDDQAETQRRNFQRGLMVSAALHVAMVAGLAFVPEPEPLRMLEVISVKLVSLPASEPAAQAAVAPLVAEPIPKPAPPAPKPVPVAKKVILPKQAQSVVKKRKPKPKPLDYADALAALRAELGEQTPVPQAALEPSKVAKSEAPATSPAPVQGVAVSAETAAWMKAMKHHVRRVWIVPPEFRNRPLQTKLLVLLSISGELIGIPEIVVSSGDPYWDDNTIRALQRASPFPPPPEAGEWPFVFSPEEPR